MGPFTKAWSCYQGPRTLKDNSWLSLPSSYQLSIAPQLWWGLRSPSLLCAGLFTGLFLYRSCTSHHSWCMLANAIVRSYPEDIAFLYSSLTSSPYNLSVLSFLMILEPWGRGIGVLLAFAEHATDTYFLHVSCEFLHSSLLHCSLIRSESCTNP